MSMLLAALARVRSGAKLQLDLMRVPQRVRQRIARLLRRRAHTSSASRKMTKAFFAYLHGWYARG